MARHGAGRQSVQKVVVGAVVSEPEHEVGGLLAVREEAPHVDTLVDALRANLDDLVALQDLGRSVLQVLMQVVEQLACAPLPVLGLGLPVVPRDAARLPLHVRARDVGRDAPEETLDRAQPAQIEVDQRAPLFTRRAREVPVLRAEVNREPTEPLLEIPPSAPADDVHVRVRHRDERPQERADLGCRLRQIGVDLELAQRPVVVEHDRSRTGAREPLPEPLLDGRVDGRRSARAALATRVAAETREEAVGPAPAVEILDALRHRLETTLPLARRQPERGRKMLDDAVDVPRVDEERAGKHLRGAGELGEQERAAPAAGKPRLGLAQNELLRHEVHPVAQRRDHHHVGAAVERDERRLRDVAMDVLDRRRARPARTGR